MQSGASSSGDLVSRAIRCMVLDSEAGKLCLRLQSRLTFGLFRSPRPCFLFAQAGPGAFSESQHLCSEPKECYTGVSRVPQARCEEKASAYPSTDFNAFCYAPKVTMNGLSPNPCPDSSLSPSCANTMPNGS